MAKQAKSERPVVTVIAGMYRKLIADRPEVHETQFRPLRRGGMDTFDAAWEVLLLNDAAGEYNRSKTGSTDAGATEYEDIIAGEEAWRDINRSK